GIVGVDDDLDIREVRKCIERQGLDRIHTGCDRQDRAGEDQDKVSRRPRDEPGDHGGLPAGDIALSADLRLLSASMRKFAATTTRSPAEMPLRISVKPPPCVPTLTSRGSKRPSPLSRITTWRVPVSITALSGTARTGRPPPAAMSTSAYMPGRSRSSGLAISIRTFVVRVCIATSG